MATFLQAGIHGKEIAIYTKLLLHIPSGGSIGQYFGWHWVLHI